MKRLHAISQKIVKPVNCALAFGIPASKERFLERQLADDANFPRRFTGWGQYHHQVAGNMEKLNPILAQWGVTVINHLKLDEFASLFSRNDLYVIILFSHFTRNSIEFDDGMACLPAIIEKIPSGFGGILDLCVCHPEELTKKLRKERPHCLVKYTHSTATPYIWLYFYLALFKYLHDHEATYLEGLERIIYEFLNPNNRK